MKNQTAKFTCAEDATLTVSINVSDKRIRVTVRNRSGVEGEKAKVLSKHFFELAEEKPAQVKFDELVAEAKVQGWVLSEKAEKAKLENKPIPRAPGAKPVNGGGQVSGAPRAAAPARR